MNAVPALLLLVLLSANVLASDANAPPVSPETRAGAPALTIYNADFAVVRERLALELQAGVNTISVSGMTYALEPDSVMLRDPTGVRALQILEQSYRNDPVTQELLLSLFEGETLDFLVFRGETTTVQSGRVVRSGYVPPSLAAGYDRYGNWRPAVPNLTTQPIIEVDGTLRFSLPGQPVFPSLSDDTVLTPTLSWELATDAAGPLAAELAYVTGGFGWEADYNAVSPEEGDVLDLLGWITMQNNSGKTFEDALVKLMAGDVNKVEEGWVARDAAFKSGGRMMAQEMGPTVTEKSFDEFHLYSVARPVTLRDRETKQVEFVRGAGIESRRLYVYDGAAMNPNRWNGWDMINLRNNPEYGTESNDKVWVMREFDNTEENGLGIPLPRGRVRFYRQDDDGRLEFTGENVIDHTPKDETLRIYTGNAFDLVGERVRTDFVVNDDQDWIDETFRITLRNHKQEPAEFRVVEHLYRWTNWEIRNASDEHAKTDSQTAEFRILVPADGEHELTYTVHYSW